MNTGVLPTLDRGEGVRVGTWCQQSRYAHEGGEEGVVEEGEGRSEMGRMVGVACSLPER